MRNEKETNYSNSSPYREQKKQIEEIVKRIDKKRTLQIFIQRSQGSLIQNQHRRKRKTEIKIQQCLRKQQEKQYKKRSFKRNTISFNKSPNFHQGTNVNQGANVNQSTNFQQFSSKKRHATQSPTRFAKVRQKQKQDQYIQNSKLNIKDQSELVIGQLLLVKKNQISEHLDQNKQFTGSQCPRSAHQNQTHLPLPQAFHKKISLVQKTMPNSPKNKLVFKPQLQQLQKFLQQKSPIILLRRKRIIQMLIICLMRRCHQKLYQALDIAIETSSYLDEEYNEIVLKCICLKLIGKLYNQIGLRQNKQRISIEKSLNRRTSKKFNNKRHSSFMIKTLASQRVFFTRFAYKYQKSKLLKQTNYKRQELKMKSCQKSIKTNNKKSEKTNFKKSQNQAKIKINKLGGIYQRKLGQLIAKNENNNLQNSPDLLIHKNNQEINLGNQEKKTIMKLNRKLAISLPKPNFLFGSELESSLQNYSIVIHLRDLESRNKLFPYEYPQTLWEVIARKQYFHLISSINSIMYAQTQCYDFFQVFKKCITRLILSVLILMMIVLNLNNFKTDEADDWIIQVVLFCLFIVSCISLFKNSENNFWGLNDRYQKMDKQLKKWNKQFQKQKVLFKTTQNCEALIICSLFNHHKIYSNSSVQYADSINQSSILSSEIDKSLFQSKQSNNKQLNNDPSNNAPSNNVPSNNVPSNNAPLNSGSSNNASSNNQESNNRTLEDMKQLKDTLPSIQETEHIQKMVQIEEMHYASGKKHSDSNFKLHNLKKIKEIKDIIFIDSQKSFKQRQRVQKPKQSNCQLQLKQVQNNDNQFVLKQVLNKKKASFNAEKHYNFEDLIQKQNNKDKEQNKLFQFKYYEFSDVDPSKQQIFPTSNHQFPFEDATLKINEQKESEQGDNYGYEVSSIDSQSFDEVIDY